MKSLVFPLLLLSAPVAAQDTFATIESELPGLEGEVRVGIPGLSQSACLQEAFSFRQELRLGMFEDVSDYLIRILERRGTPLDQEQVNARFEQKGGWGLGDEYVNDAYCNALREELAKMFDQPENSTWRQLVQRSRQ